MTLRVFLYAEIYGITRKKIENISRAGTAYLFKNVLKFGFIDITHYRIACEYVSKLALYVIPTFIKSFPRQSRLKCFKEFVKLLVRSNLILPPLLPGLGFVHFKLLSKN